MAGEHPGHHLAAGDAPQLIAWEVTRSCLLSCKHCRASASRDVCEGELSTAECYRLLDGVAAFARPIIILTGGEPMLRADIYDIAAYACKLGLSVVMAPCGLLVNEDSARKIVASGVRRISLSLDGAVSETHDAFRGLVGSYDSIMKAVEACRTVGLDFQINSTVSRHNIAEFGELMELSKRLGASVFNPFLLVPTGRGKGLVDQELTPEQYEQALGWLSRQQARKDIQIRVTCAPHYQRVLRQCGMGEQAGRGRGCMGGKGFAFVSHTGKVQICGFLDVECGDVREAGFDFRRIWETSPVFRQVRDVDNYHGKCGWCEYRRVCGGCRARAFAMGGDYLGEEPFCTYQPGSKGGAQALGLEAGLTENDKAVLSVIQAGFPLERPFEVLGERLGMPAADVLAAVRRLAASGVIRRFGAVFDSRKLGFASTLVAAKVPSNRLESVAGMVTALRGVTHNYARRHEYNLWFTLTGPTQQELDRVLGDLRARAGGCEFFSLPAVAMYKSRVIFSLGREARPEEPVADVGDAEPVQLDERARGIVRAMQGDWPVVDEPLVAMAGQLGMPADDLRAQTRRWLEQGVIRRIGAVVAHRRIGVVANGMAVFAAAADRIDRAGRRLAGEEAISHCYARPTLPGWQYNLFAMVHGRSESEVRNLVQGLASELGLGQWEVLFSTEEFKKTSMQFW